MIVYNISNKVETAIEADWVQWQQQEHIPAIMASGQFTDYKFYKLLMKMTMIVQPTSYSTLRQQKSIITTTFAILRRKEDRKRLKNGATGL